MRIFEDPSVPPNTWYVLNPKHMVYEGGDMQPLWRGQVGDPIPSRQEGDPLPDPYMFTPYWTWEQFLEHAQSSSPRRDIRQKGHT